jgi:uncharacterized protein (TIGR03437 family)
MSFPVRRALFLSLPVLSFLLLEPALFAQQVPRRPRGIYAVVNVEGSIALLPANPSAAQLDTYFNGVYQNLLANPAISGLALQLHWDRLNPNPPAAANAYAWNISDDAFNQVAAWNAQNPALAPKTIQLIVTPGFNSPPWMLNQLTSCDGLFATPVQTPLNTCGRVTFTGYQEDPDGTQLPLPWNATYKSAWRTFLTALNARYGSNPAFVSIAVDGPTAASAEMTTASNGDTPNPQTQFGTPISPNDMWRQLLALQYAGLPAYQNSDQAFIEEWDRAIDMFGQVFSGVTLVATTGGNLPSFNQNFTIPPGFNAFCPNPTMDCAAVATILSYFTQSSVGGANAKASQTSGLEASRAIVAGNAGVAGVKWLSQNTAQATAPASQILGGAQFNTSFSNGPVGEGCLDDFPPDATDTPVDCVIPATCNANGCLPVDCIPQGCLAPGVTYATLAAYQTYGKVPNALLISPEQAEYNVLSIYFNGTAAAPAFGGIQGSVPLNYLQIYFADIQYAQMNAGAPAQVVPNSGASVPLSAQELLDLASPKLLGLGEPALVLAPSPGITPGSIGPTLSNTGMIEPGEWISIYGTNLANAPTSWSGDFPTSLAGVSVAIDGRAAYLYYVSPAQIDLQVPADIATGVVPVVVTTPSGSAASTATLSAFGPAFFLLDAKHVAGIILRTDGSGAYGGGTYDVIGPIGTSLGYKTVAAKAGDVVELYGTGFGPTSPAVPAGQAYSGAAKTTNAVTLHINNVNVPPTFAGLSGAGLYQVNATVPAGLGSGDVSVQITVGGVQTPSGAVISLQ